MDNLIKYFNSIESSFARMKNLSLVCVIVAACFSLAAGWLAFDYASKASGKVFILDKGTALMACAANNEAQRDLEIEDHVTRFHEFMFNLSPNRDAIERNMEKALALCDESAYDYWQDLSERGFYQRIVSANISQQMFIDSVSINMQKYPYQAHAYGQVYIIRESNITQYAFESTCRLVDIERSPSNPHGLMMEKFTVIRNEKKDTKPRN